MRHVWTLCVTATVAAAACTAIVPAPASAPSSGPAALPQTRAERSSYLETSTWADVTDFLATLDRAHLPIALGTLGTSTEGRAIPLAIASRPLVRTPDAARRLERPIVYVQANIHAGEVEGKEALLALLRDLAAEPAPNVLDSIVLVAVPIYNADGNERFAAQARNREEQNGPEMVGQRPNGQGLDLNRDYVKAEAPETRASLAAFAAWDPDVFVDLHTTDGSFHGYALTYAPPLAPVGGAAPFVRDSLLPVLRERMRTRDHFETFDYGNFDNEDPSYRGYAAAGASPGDTVTRAWQTYDHRPRFGTNYTGIRGGAAILSEAFSHDPFERRVRSTYAFVREILSLAAERGPSLARVKRDAAGGPPIGSMLAIRARVTRTPYRGPVIVEDLERVADSNALTQPGVPRGKRRSGHYRTLQLAIYDRFEPEYSVPVPAGYAIPPDGVEIVRALRLHGIIVDQTSAPLETSVASFFIDSVTHAKRLFQGHYETTLHGHWTELRSAIQPVGTYIVSTAQPFGALAVYLLEPESDDGLVTWNTFDEIIRRGADFPVVRLATLPAFGRRPVP